jgi:hypothetical protein
LGELGRRGLQAAKGFCVFNLRGVERGELLMGRGWFGKVLILPQVEAGCKGVVRKGLCVAESKVCKVLVVFAGVGVGWGVGMCVLRAGVGGGRREEG